MNEQANEDAYHEICYYTLSLGDREFIHQHVVDAFAAQNAKQDDKPIGLAFALVGLFLCVEKGFTGRQVQLAHMKLARHKTDWPTFPMPSERGEITAVDVSSAAPGAEKDQLIHDWCASVWKAFSRHREEIESLLNKYNVL